MAERKAVFTIPAHRAFADALAAGMLGRIGKDDLPRALLLLPNRRAVRAVTEAFVRASGGALLLPRMLPIGDVGENEALGLFDEAMALEADVQPAIAAFERRMLLMPLVHRWQQLSGRARSSVETLRLADALARTLDQLQLEGIEPARLHETMAELGAHWEATLNFLEVVVTAWPPQLAARGLMDRVARRQMLLGAIARRWRASPPARPIVAAGMASADPAVADVLAVVAGLPRGAVVLPGLDLQTPDWDDIRGFPAHPQCGLLHLLEAMSIARDEVRVWEGTSALDGPEARAGAIGAALSLAGSTAHWPPAGPLADLRFAEAANPAGEAGIIALAMRRQLDTPGATAALVTPDRGLARRVAAQLRRWDIEVDDSAGTPLARAPSGTLLLAALEAGAQRCAPGALLALLKHPLTGPGEGRARLNWLDDVRRLDLALRGVRPAAGLKGISARVKSPPKGALPETERSRLAEWWKALRPRLDALEALMAKPRRLGDFADGLRAFAEAMSEGRVWEGAAGRAAAETIAEMVQHGDMGLRIPPADLPALLGAMLGDVAVRPPFGKHPRLAIYGLLEARLQRADLMILGGLNEGVWPGGDPFDPWIPPAIRRRLGLPETERAIGLAAHDFVLAAAAPHVLLTRARRDASAPTVASRFWLRLLAFAGDHAAWETELPLLAAAIDARGAVPPAERPRPSPPVADRPRQISVTQIDRLLIDPYSFYAEKMLRLRPLDPLDADLSAAERGTIVHAVIETLIAAGTLHDPAGRAAAIDAAIAAHADQPLVAALWRPRIVRMLDWVAELMRARAAGGWGAVRSEVEGRVEISGVTLKGKADIVQAGPEGVLIADFKTGKVPGQASLADGFASQLGLLAWLAEEGALDGPASRVVEVAYWKLSGGKDAGEEKTSARHYKKAWSDLPAFIDICRAAFREAVSDYLAGSRPFEAKVKPEYAVHLQDYDHLARLAEWWGRK
ncbi:double-strand break repair protein AddB [Sphingosinicella soli]|uniref:ATP-dependent helicase/nuclease subunit B n=1 Tax=Sphingosinicella soli TaxID=333708 RepID=A0A7W7B1A0_9SPHN|nr:double-strand break repair protein AddB [Sphingosinicella soli]MBB4632199.1 ATP-dependent helicase/nuclease subunit B [Sphingosinicella soli]